MWGIRHYKIKKQTEQATNPGHRRCVLNLMWSVVSVKLAVFSYFYYWALFRVLIKVGTCIHSTLFVFSYVAA